MGEVGKKERHLGRKGARPFKLLSEGRVGALIKSWYQNVIQDVSEQYTRNRVQTQDRVSDQSEEVHFWGKDGEGS